MINILNSLRSSVSGTEIADQHSALQSPRRRRSLGRMIGRRLDRIFGSRRLFPLAMGLCLLAGFIHISLVNDVFVVKDHRSYVYKNQSAEPKGYTQATASNRPQYNERTRPPQAINSERPTLATTSMPEFGEGVLKLSGIEAGLYDVRPKVSEAIAPTQSQAAQLATYRVSEGSSLWETGKQFIDDAAVLNELIDDLATSGIDVLNVRPGVVFVVSKLGEQDLLVIVDIAGNRYKSRIIQSTVTTSVVAGASSFANGADT